MVLIRDLYYISGLMFVFKRKLMTAVPLHLRTTLMKLTVTFDKQYDAASPIVTYRFKYLDRTYEEIINEREFGIESLWSTVGGLIGIFVGTSLSQVPSLIAIAWNWVRNQVK